MWIRLDKRTGIWKRFILSKMSEHNKHDRVMCKTCTQIFNNTKEEVVHVKHLCSTDIFCIKCYAEYNPTKLGKDKTW